MTKYYAVLVPGLERTSWREIQSELEEVEFIEEKIGKVLFSYSGDPSNLLYLRSVENVYALVRNIKNITRSRNSLGEIFKSTQSADFQAAALLQKQAHKSKGRKRLTFKVVSEKVGRHNFRRVDAQRAVESAIEGKYRWKLERHDPTLEIRIDVAEDSALIGLKITSETTRRRAYKVIDLPASLKPSVAYCMALLSEPSPKDVFVDPMCGAGTIAIERALAGAFRKVVAADVEESVVHSARGNVEASGESIDLAVWDVSAMPLRDRSVDKIACNMPFGKQIGTRAGNQELYSDFFKEMLRIMKSGGKAVLLSSERNLMDELIRKYSSIYMRKKLKIDLLGVRAYIYVMSFR